MYSSKLKFCWVQVIFFVFLNINVPTLSIHFQFNQHARREGSHAQVKLKLGGGDFELECRLSNSLLSF